MLDVIFNMKKIKFDVIDNLINENKINISTGKVNMFINIEPLLKHLSTSKINEYMRVSNEDKVLQLISNIVNLAAHYRLYFSSRKIKSNIYMYIQHPFNTEYKNQKILTNFRGNYRFLYDTNINNFVIYDNITTAISMIKIILEYVENVYLIESGEIENSVIPYIISQQNNYTNFILSTDIYDMQYCNYGYNILYPKQDNSKLITYDNMMQQLSDINKIDMSKLSGNQLALMLSIMGNTDRNIYGIKGTGKTRAVKLLSSAMDIGLINKDTNNINLLLPIIKKPYRDEIEKNFHCIDIRSQYNNCTKKDIYYIMSQLKDKFDNVSLKEVNDKYFEMYPLMLEAITSKPRQDRTVIF